jgi:hypothetical protein
VAVQECLNQLIVYVLILCGDGYGRLFYKIWNTHQGIVIHVMNNGDVHVVACA